MTFYGPTFPSETHYDKLFTGRQRFGNRSANMFFIRPARHIAAPRRLKYIHDVKTGYIPYVEDSVYDHRPQLPRFPAQKSLEEERGRTSSLGLYNSNDAWRQELMDLAHQVKTTLYPSEDEERNRFHHQASSRSSRSRKLHGKRSSSSAMDIYPQENDDHSPNRRLLTRRAQASTSRLQTFRAKTCLEKERQEPEQTANDEQHDSGIWLIPILCHILQIDDIDEAQDWLMNANPTEKRLAMALISRTMQDMQNSDLETGVETSVTQEATSTASNNMNNLYWPYKVYQQKEKQRQSFQRMAKSSSTSGFPSLSIDINDTCERATSPLRMMTPAKPSSTVNELIISTDGYSFDRLSTRQSNGHVSRQNPSPIQDASNGSQKPSSNNERRSRLGYRVATSISQTGSSSNVRNSPVARGKTPLI